MTPAEAGAETALAADSCGHSHGLEVALAPCSLLAPAWTGEPPDDWCDRSGQGWQELNGDAEPGQHLHQPGQVLAVQPGSRMTTPSSRSPVRDMAMAIRWSA